MGKYGRLGKNTLLVFGGNAGAKLIGLLMLPFYTSWLSVEDYGTTDIINVYASLLLGIVTACISDSIFIFPKGQSVEKQKSYFTSGLFFSIIVIILTAFIFQIISALYASEPQNSFIKNIWLIYGILVTTFIQQYTQQFSRSIDKIQIYSTSGIILTISTAAFSFLLIPSKGVFGYVFAIIISNLIAAIYTYILTKSYQFTSFSLIKKEACYEMLKYSIPLIPNGVMWWIVSSINRPMMESYLGMHSIGIFAIAAKFPGILTIVFTIFVTSWQISVLEEFGKKDYSQFFNKIFRLMIVGLIILFFMLSSCRKLIITLFTTPEFYEAYKYIPLLLFSVIFSSISGFVGTTFSATRESKYFFLSSIWGAIVSIISNLVLIPKLGILGAAISVPLSFVAMALSRIYYGWKYVKIQNIKLYLTMFFICILFILTLSYIQSTLLEIILISSLITIFTIINIDLKNDVFIFIKKINKK